MATFTSPRKAMHWDRQFLARPSAHQRDCPGRTILVADAVLAGRRRRPAVVVVVVAPTAAFVLAAFAAVAAA